jgi:pimeloyl-ACP methyl ester carboxylesterase
MAAQVFLALYPERATHGVLIGTLPPCAGAKLAEQLFFDTAVKPFNDLPDEVVLFFEPRSEASREAARQSAERMAQRTADRSVPVPVEFAAAFLGSKPRSPAFPAPPVLAALKATRIPILHIGGDHDISCPVENWYALNAELPSVQLLTFPRTGHAPQHQYPEVCAQHIATFVGSTGRNVEKP